MLISVIIPVYNVEKYIQQCIESVLGQSYQDFELLLIDDGSTDSSGAICDAYAAKDARVRAFHKKNGGVSSARNIGIEKAKGDYIWFIDADDWIIDRALEILVLYLSKNDSIEAVSFGHRKFLQSTNNFLTTINPIHISARDPKCYIETLQYFRPNVWCYIYNRKFLKDHNILFVSQDYFEDEIFNLDVLAHIKKIANLGRMLYIYRQREESAMTSNFSHRRLNSYNRLFKAYQDFILSGFDYAFVWKNLFTYLNDALKGMKILELGYKERIIFIRNLKQRIQKIKIERNDSKGMILIKILYNYFPVLLMKI